MVVCCGFCQNVVIFIIHLFCILYFSLSLARTHNNSSWDGNAGDQGQDTYALWDVWVPRGLCVAYMLKVCMKYWWIVYLHTSRDHWCVICCMLALFVDIWTLTELPSFCALTTLCVCFQTTTSSHQFPFIYDDLWPTKMLCMTGDYQSSIS